MTSGEEYLEARRSGLHKQKQDIDQGRIDYRDVVHPDNSQIYTSMDELYRYYKEIKNEFKLSSFLSKLNFIWLLILTIFMISFFKSTKERHASKKETKQVVIKKSYPVPTVKTVYKTKTKTVIPKEYREAMENIHTKQQIINQLVTESKSNNWRRKLCYGYRDREACLAYKKPLGWRTRVRRRHRRL